MNREVRINIIDLCLGYGCIVLVTYAIGSIAYSAGKTKVKVEFADTFNVLTKGDNHEK